MSSRTSTTKSCLLKVILLGDGGVGKSSLMNRYVCNSFDDHCFHTIGVEFLNKDIEVDGRRYTLQIWDTAGQERFRSLRTPFYRGSDVCLLTCALDDVQSFKNLLLWKKEFLYYADVKDPQTFPFVVVANKDDVENRAVSSDEIAEWCRTNGDLPFLETSAKTASNVSAAFEAAVKKLVELEASSGNSLASRVANGNTVNLDARELPEEASSSLASRVANGNTVNLDQNRRGSACC